MSELCKSLEDEHRVIERVLDAIEAELSKVDDGQQVQSAFFREVIGFVREFADGIHHQKEEKILFPALLAAGLPEQDGPVAVMLTDHEQGRGFIRSLEQALDSVDAGDQTATTLLSAAARGYVSLLREHIQKEDIVLFPMSDQLLDKERKAKVTAEFEKAEAADAGTADRRRNWAMTLDTASQPAR